MCDECEYVCVYIHVFVYMHTWKHMLVWDWSNIHFPDHENIKECGNNIGEMATKSEGIGVFMAE